MKRTLIEVSCGLAALVGMVSMYHKVDRIEGRTTEVLNLRDQVQSAVEKVASAPKDDREKAELQAVQSRLAQLQEQLQKAEAGSALAVRLQSEMQSAKSDVSLLKSQLSTDVERTKQLVDAYITESRKKEREAAAAMVHTQDAIAAIAGQLRRDTTTLTRDMLLPTVQLNGDDTVGSGTLVWSGSNPKNGLVESYVLTAYHVVRNILADTPRAQKEGFLVTVYVDGEKVEVRGKMVASAPKIDAALVQLLTTRTFPNVANVLPRTACSTIEVWDPICAVGCPLGNDPVPSQGEVSSLKNELNGANYWMITAPTYFGNSGGGVYRADTHQLIGVFSKIYTHGKGSPVVIPHMGLCTPMDEIYKWLQEDKYDHVLQCKAVNVVDLTQLASPVK
jgi:S1-C subfamily serine protease